MSLSHRKKAQISEAFTCPECGKMCLARVVETCRLQDGPSVRRLPHYKCSSCGAQFFDDDAMHRIQAARASRGSLTQSR